MQKLTEILRSLEYPGRGIAIGASSDGLYGVVVYFITGRSEGSRNRVFAMADDGTLSTRVFDLSMETGVADLTLYNAVRYSGDVLVVTNGTQTDDLFEHDEPISHILAGWDYEHDSLCTPRISGLMSPTGEVILSILKASNGSGSGSVRNYFEYPRIAGESRFICVYDGDNSNPGAFEGEPLRVETPTDVRELWESLNSNNRVSIYMAKFPLGGAAWTPETVSAQVVNRHA